MPIIYKIVLLSGGFFTALIAGLFYSYSCSVNIGLGRLPDDAYLRAMQSINRAILNSWFFASFIGTLILLPICTWMLYRHEAASTGFYLILSATLIYLIAVFGVTMFGNVPLNEALDKLDIGSASPGELEVRRVQFERPWNNLNLTRTIGALISLLLTLAALTVRL
jgi:uncharacterized membrane protein